jgi:hypothetical protein
MGSTDAEWDSTGRTRAKPLVRPAADRVLENVLILAMSEDRRLTTAASPMTEL